MQIEAAQDLNMISSRKVINLLYKVEQFIFKKTDVISSISEKMVSKITLPPIIPGKLKPKSVITGGYKFGKM